MIVAVASGKGGTGKTTVAAALARLWPVPRIAADLDVEAPNLHLFLDPTVAGRAASILPVPVVAHPERCDGCGACSRICAFKAVLCFGDFPVAFPEMCHGCGGCLAVCPRGVFTEGTRALGEVRWGLARDADGAGFEVLTGEMRVGEAMSPPLIRDVLKRLSPRIPEGGDAILDAPPGTSCPVMAAVRPADAIVLVTEPTPFGLHDLDLAWKAFAPLSRPAGVVINRAGGAGEAGDAAVRAWAAEQGLPILAALPFDREVAAAYARRLPADTVSPAHRARLAVLAERVRTLARSRSAEAAHARA